MTSAPAPMNTLAGRRRRVDWTVWQRRLLNVAVAVLVGYILGQQIIDTQPRVMKGLVGLAVLYAAWKFPIPVSLSAFLLLFPFPFTISYGSSNTIFIFLITAMWLAQIVLRTSRPVGRTMLDLPILMLMGAYLVSFSSVTNNVALVGGLENFSNILACVFVYYLIVHTVRDEKTLRRVLDIITLTALLTFVVGLYELIFPGRPFIKGWILSQTYYQTDIQTGLRVGGPFGDFELYAEYCAMMFPLFLFRLIRAEGGPTRWLWAGLTFLNFFVLMSTVTRGATISLLAASLYLLFRLRKVMTMRQMLFTITLGVTGFFVLDTFLANYTVSGSIMGRIMDTKFVNGLPDSRTFWPLIIERIQEKPWFGHGPFYEFGQFGQEKLTTYFWPHNGYLYLLHTIGVLGTSAFLWMFGILWIRTSRNAAPSLWDRNFNGALLLTLNVSLTVFLIDQLKIEYLRNANYQYFPWIVIGLTVATLNVHRASERSGEAVPANPKTARTGWAWRRKTPAPPAGAPGAVAG